MGAGQPSVEQQGELAGVVHRNIRALIWCSLAAGSSSTWGSSRRRAVRSLSVRDAGDVRLRRGNLLSTFVLITQNRMAQISERRAELDLQISLLAEHEVTRLLSMVDAIGGHLGVHFQKEGLEELKKDVAPEKVLDEIEHATDAPHH